MSMQDQSCPGLHKTKYHQQHYSACECQVNVSVSCIFTVVPVYRCIQTSCYFLLVVKSLVELVPYSFSIEGVKVFFSERLCQDPLMLNITELIHKGEDVEFYTCMLFSVVDEGVASTLLNSTIKLWVTMRGFSFASSWIELYQHTKTSLQRS